MDHIIDVSFLGDCTYMRRVCLLTSRFLVSESPGFLGGFGALFTSARRSMALSTISAGGAEAHSVSSNGLLPSEGLLRLS